MRPCRWLLFRSLSTFKKDYDKLVFNGIDMDAIISKSAVFPKARALAAVRDQVLLAVKDAENDIRGLLGDIKAYREKILAFQEKTSSLQLQLSRGEADYEALNTRFLKASGNLSLRRIMENFEARFLLLNKRRVTRKELWSQILERAYIFDRFSQLSLTDKTRIVTLASEVYAKLSKFIHEYASEEELKVIETFFTEEERKFIMGLAKIEKVKIVLVKPE